jgi:hypothetical protein
MATYKANHREVARFLKSLMLKSAVEHEAERIADHLRATAPRGSGDDDADHYADHFRVETGFDVRERDRRAAFVINDSPYASVLELGSGHVKNPPQPITRFIAGARD